LSPSLHERLQVVDHVTLEFEHRIVEPGCDQRVDDRRRRTLEIADGRLRRHALIIVLGP
jgi:hypothetical protein